MGLFDDIKAFDAFFDDHIEWEHDGVRTMIDCCMFPFDDSALMLDTNLQTGTKLANILICKYCNAVVPDVGDIVQDKDGTKFAIMSVQKECMWTKLTAREVADD